MIGSLPFRDFNGHIQGVLRLEEEEIVLEWRSVMGWPFLMGWPLKRRALHLVRIPLNQLESIEYRNPFYLFHATLRMRVRSLELLAQVPGSSGAEITVYCKKPLP